MWQKTQKRRDSTVLILAAVLVATAGKNNLLAEGRPSLFASHWGPAISVRSGIQNGLAHSPTLWSRRQRWSHSSGDHSCATGGASATALGEARDDCCHASFSLEIDNDRESVFEANAMEQGLHSYGRQITVVASSWGGRRGRKPAGIGSVPSDKVELCGERSAAAATGSIEEQPLLARRGGGTKSSAAGAAAAQSLGGGSIAASIPPRPLVFWENMVCGAISRSVAQTLLHPANTMKTIMQSSRASVAGAGEAVSLRNLAQPQNLRLLTRGAGAQFLMSVPHGAVNFAVLEYVRRRMNQLVTSGRFGERFNHEAFGPGLDFLSSAISTICCSIVSTPQMMITDNIMAGTYPNLPKAVAGLSSEKGIQGFYSGWWPGLAGKIPSYALTWTFFQQLKAAHLRFSQRPPKDIENSMMGCLASATTVCIMIPMDTIKTRLVTQARYPDLVQYSGIIDCAVRITKEEGVTAFYRGLAPRLISVVPMIGVQFGVYEFMKKVMLDRANGEKVRGGRREFLSASKAEKKRKLSTLEEVAMEVAADDEQPFPAPQFHEEDYGTNDRKSKRKGWNRRKKVN